MRLPKPAHAGYLRIVCTSSDQPAAGSDPTGRAPGLAFQTAQPRNLQTRANTRTADALHLTRGGDNDLRGR